MRIQMCGDVVADDAADLYRAWGYTVCCPRDVRKAVETCPEGEDLILEVNSLGGSVYAGFEIYTLLRGRQGRTVAEIQSIAASAASVVAAGCGTVLISPVAEVMIHRASIWRDGTSESMRQAAQMLETIDESILTAYVRKSGGKTDRETFAGMMQAETFLTADQAVKCGLADGILDAAGPGEAGPGEDAAGPKDAVARMDGRPPKGTAPEIFAAARLPPVEDLRKMAAEAVGKRGERKERERKERRRDSMDDEKTVGTPGTPDRTPEAREPTTLEELRERYPALAEQIAKEAAAEAAEAERRRIAEIEEQALPGFEGLIAEAKADPTATAGSVALRIVRAQRESGAAWIAARDADVETGRVDEVRAAAAPDPRSGGPDAAGDVDAAARDAVALWKRRGAAAGAAGGEI